MKEFWVALLLFAVIALCSGYALLQGSLGEIRFI